MGLTFQDVTLPAQRESVEQQAIVKSEPPPCEENTATCLVDRKSPFGNETESSESTSPETACSLNLSTYSKEGQSRLDR